MYSSSPHGKVGHSFMEAGFGSPFNGSRSAELSRGVQFLMLAARWLQLKSP